ncbi:unnamed protein product [Rotaria sordida]|uniref:RRM domain-containing protein n=1 Tax=Rotaria sordida TaxID=392033 RepID=A0A815J374_9BILA|nr:unnamed protein product [Rotaria sordida]CAF3995130.1 unnamed protein product [Rotaria sordida]
MTQFLPPSDKLSHEKKRLPYGGLFDFVNHFEGYPQSNEKATIGPYKTLFIARLNYDTSETKLKHEFEIYGKIKSIHLTHDKQTGKPHGYVFIEYEKESDMHDRSFIKTITLVFLLLKTQKFS